MKDDWSGFPASIFVSAAQSLVGRVLLFFASLCTGLWLGAFTTASIDAQIFCDFPEILIGGPTLCFYLSFEMHWLLGVFYLGFIASVACASFLLDASVLKTSFLLVVLQTTIIYLAVKTVQTDEPPFEIPVWRPLLTFGTIGAIIVLWFLARRRARLDSEAD